MTLREARDKREWTQQDLEAATRKIDPDGRGVEQTHISKLERGVVLDPKSSKVALLEKALGVERGTLVFGQREALAS